MIALLDAVNDLLGRRMTLGEAHSGVGVDGVWQGNAILKINIFCGVQRPVDKGVVKGLDVVAAENIGKLERLQSPEPLDVLPEAGGTFAKAQRAGKHCISGIQDLLLFQ